MMYVIVILSVFLASCAQMLLKKGAHQQYETWWRQYINGWVVGGYAIMLGSMMMNIFAMSRGVDVKEVSIIETLSYLFVPLLSFVISKERLIWQKVYAIAIIIIGVLITLHKL